MRNTARDFAAREVEPHAATWERERIFPREALRAAGAAGLADVRLPGHSLVEACEVFEELAAADYAFTFALACHAGAAGVLARHGRDPDAVLRGDEIGAFCLTEPGAGT